MEKSSAPEHPVLALQRRVGNQAVQRILANAASMPNVQRVELSESFDDWRPTGESNSAPVAPVSTPVDRSQQSWSDTPPPEKSDREQRGGPKQFGPDTSLPWDEYLDRYVGPKNNGPGDPAFQSTNEEER